MKKIIFIFTAIIALTFGACSPDEVTINPLEPTDPLLIGAVLNTPSVTTFDIVQTTDTTVGNEANEAVALTWETATGDNDGSILYYVQMDITGNEFKTAVTIPLAASGTAELTRALTFGELNEAMNQVSVNLVKIASALSVKFDEANVVDVRVQTILGASIAVQYSEIINITITPYFTGLSDEISIKGDALASDVMLVNTDGVFKNRVELTASTFRFFAEPSETNISYNYQYFDSRGYTIDPLLVNANDTEMNFSFTGEEGAWDLILDTNSKTIELVEVVAPDNLYLIGSLTGWDPATAFPFHNNGDNTFTISAHLVDGDQFKFIPTNTSWDGAWKEDPNNPGSIINEGGDPNIGGYPAGQYLITVDFNSLTFTMKEINNLYLVGTISDPAWTPTAAIKMGNPSAGVFSLIRDLKASDEFKFLPTNIDWSGDFGEDPNNPNKGFDGDDEKNITVAEDGTYVISYNYTTNDIIVSKIVIPTQLYLVGSFRGWNNDAGNPKFTEVATNVFEITQALAANDEFKFVKSNTGGDWANDIAQNKTSPLVIEQNGEGNIKVTTDGTYTITVNFNNGTIKLSK